MPLSNSRDIWSGVFERSISIRSDRGRIASSCSGPCHSYCLCSKLRGAQKKQKGKHRRAKDCKTTIKLECTPFNEHDRHPLAFDFPAAFLRCWCPPLSSCRKSRVNLVARWRGEHHSHF